MSSSPSGWSLQGGCRAGLGGAGGRLFWTRCFFGFGLICILYRKVSPNRLDCSFYPKLEIKNSFAQRGKAVTLFHAGNQQTHGVEGGEGCGRGSARRLWQVFSITFQNLGLETSPRRTGRKYLHGSASTQGGREVGGGCPNRETIKPPRQHVPAGG